MYDQPELVHRDARVNTCQRVALQFGNLFGPECIPVMGLAILEPWIAHVEARSVQTCCSNARWKVRLLPQAALE